MSSDYFPCVTLQYIVCISFDEGVFPEDLKHATITHIINSILDSDELKSYPPISNTVYLAKVLEKATYCQINN